MTNVNPQPGSSPPLSAKLNSKTGSSRQGKTLSQVLSKLTSSNANPWAILGEIVLLPLIAVGLGIILNPEDPLWIHASFPWVWFAPVVLALRYGPLKPLLRLLQPLQGETAGAGYTF